MKGQFKTSLSDGEPLDTNIKFVPMPYLYQHHICAPIKCVLTPRLYPLQVRNHTTSLLTPCLCLHILQVYTHIMLVLKPCLYPPLRYTFVPHTHYYPKPCLYPLHVCIHTMFLLTPLLYNFIVNNLLS